MKKHLIRLSILGVIPCLLADPALSAGVFENQAIPPVSYDSGREMNPNDFQLKKQAAEVLYLQGKFGSEIIDPVIEDLRNLLAPMADRVIREWADTWQKSDEGWFRTASAKDKLNYARFLMALMRDLLSNQRASLRILGGPAETFLQHITVIFMVSDITKLSDRARIEKLTSEHNRQLKASETSVDGSENSSFYSSMQGFHTHTANGSPTSTNGNEKALARAA